MERIYIIDGARTPIGKYGGMFSEVLPELLGGTLLKKLLNRNELTRVDEVITGNVIGGGGNVSRRISLVSGLDVTVPAFTIDRQCASGLESILVATAKIKSGMAECIACGGVESTSRAPWLIERPTRLYGRNPFILERAPLSIPEYGDPAMGIACEKLAEGLQIDRLMQDQYAYESQMNYQKAKSAEVFSKEIISFNQFHEDECPRPKTTIAKLSALPSAFCQGGSLTAGNSSPLSDGAAFLLLASERYCLEHQLNPLFEIIDGASIGVLPEKFGLGPIYATEKLLKKNEMTLLDMDRIELNEAFAAQVLACFQLEKWPENRVNVSGGALAYGHPFGATGTILVRRLMSELQQKDHLKKGLVTMCVGGGQGTTLMLRKVSSQ